MIGPFYPARIGPFYPAQNGPFLPALTLVKIQDSELTSENTLFKGSLNDPALKVEGFANYGLLHEIYAITLLFAYIMTGKSNWAKITDPDICRFIQRGTNPNKNSRFQSLIELGKAVINCLDELQKKEYSF